MSIIFFVNQKLLNQLENTGPPPASDEQLKNLPVVTIGQEEVEKNVQCAVCMEDFQLNDKAKKLPCKHYFHEPCITEWLKLVSDLNKINQNIFI